MLEPLDFAREIWREFNLNSSKGSGMKITENGVVTKSYGADTEIRGKVMGETIVGYRRPVEKMEQEKRMKR